MKTHISSDPSPLRRNTPRAKKGFALISTIMILSVVTVLVMALFTTTQVEMRTSAAYANQFRAELGIEAGYHEAEQKLAELLKNDHHLIVRKEHVTPEAGNPRKLEGTGKFTYYAVNYEQTADTKNIEDEDKKNESKYWKATPLVSVSNDLDSEIEEDKSFYNISIRFKEHRTKQQPGSELRYGAYDPNPAPGANIDANGYHRGGLPYFDGVTPDVTTVDDKRAEFTPVNYIQSDFEENISNTQYSGQAENTKQVAAWREIAPTSDTDDSTDALVDHAKYRIEYSYWIEDLQGYLDVQVMGDKGPRKDYDDVEPPGYEPSEVLLYNLLNPLASKRSTGDHLEIYNNREKLLSPQTPFYLMEDQTSTGSDSKIMARSYFTTGLRPYEESPEIPMGLGYYDAADLDYYEEKQFPFRRINLNKKLRDANRDNAITAIDDHIEKFLTDNDKNFEDRKGGFPQDYGKTIAANMLDYADADSIGSSGTDYRGIDAYPFVSEVFYRFVYDSYDDTTKIVTFKVTPYVEFWNMSNRDFSGNFRFKYHTGYNYTVAGSSPVTLLDTSLVKDRSIFSDEQSDGWWMTNTSLDVKANEYKLVELSTIEYELRNASSDPTPRVQINSGGGENYYAIEIEGNVLDGNTVSGSGLGAPTRNLDAGDIVCLSYMPGYTYGSYYATAVYNFGDPRIAHYVRNYRPRQITYYNYASPGIRNTPTSSSKELDAQNNKCDLKDEMLPSLWPDIGDKYQGGTRGNASNYPREVTLSSGQNTHIGGSATNSIPPDQAAGNNPSYNSNDEQKYLAYISNSKSDVHADETNAPYTNTNTGVHVQKYLSLSELGHIFDPVMWEYVSNTRFASSGNTFGGGKDDIDIQFEEIDTNDSSSDVIGGGNTLRIGRPEHGKFFKAEDERVDKEASRLLDLFHIGQDPDNPNGAQAEDRILVQDRVNINTASREVLRAIIAGDLKKDRYQEADNGTLTAPTLDNADYSERNTDEAGVIADAIIARRPFLSESQIALMRYNPDDPHGLDKKKLDEQVGSTSPPKLKMPHVFGNAQFYETGDNYPKSWNDAAREELFARVYNRTTLRSRNFRVYVKGRVVNVSKDADGNEVKTPLAETGKVYHVFVEPVRETTDDESKLQLYNRIKYNRVIKTYEREL